MKVLCAVEKLVFITNDFSRVRGDDFDDDDDDNDYQNGKERNLAIDRTVGDLKIGYLRAILKFAAVQTLKVLITLLRLLLKAPLTHLKVALHQKSASTFKNCFPTKPYPELLL